MINLKDELYMKISLHLKAMLDKHERLVHHKERPFSCHICNKRFGQKVHLDVHISGVHMKERPYGNDKR